MPDYLISLHDPALPFPRPVDAHYSSIRAVATNHLLEEIVGAHFWGCWKNEVRVAIARGTCRVVQSVAPGHEGDILGFACFDATFIGAFGPFGVLPNVREKGLGSFLFLSVLSEMRARDHKYAFIGSVDGPVTEFYRKLLGSNFRPV